MSLERPHPKTSLTGYAVAGVKWNSISAVFTSVMQFAYIAVMARLLTYSDFGLMEILTVINGFFLVYIDAGVGNAIVQRRSITGNQLSSLYWLNILAGIALFSVLFFAAPVLALPFKQPELVPLIRLISVALLILPIGQQFRFLLLRELRYRALALMDMTASLSQFIVAVSLALNGAGVFALIFGFLAYMISQTLILFFLGIRRWRPSMRLRFTEIREFLSFGAFQLGSRSLNYFNASVDRLLIGAFTGTAALGFYSLAWKVVVQPIVRLNPILIKTAFPLFSCVSEDRQRLRRGYLKLISIVSLINTPILMGMAAVAPVMTPVIFGAQWTPSTVLIQLLAFVMINRSIGNPAGSLLLARGRADIDFYWNFTLIFTQTGGVVAGALIGGAVGVAVALLILQLVYSVLNYLLLVRQNVGPCLSSYLGSILPPFAISTVMTVCVALLPGALSLQGSMLLIIQVMAGAVLYSVMIFLFMRNRAVEMLGYFAARQPNS